MRPAETEAAFLIARIFKRVANGSPSPWGEDPIQAISGNADASLHDKRAALDQKLTDVKNATQDNWNDAKTAFENSYADVKNSVKQDWEAR